MCVTPVVLGLSRSGLDLGFRSGDELDADRLVRLTPDSGRQRKVRDGDRRCGCSSIGGHLLFVFNGLAKYLLDSTHIEVLGDAAPRELSFV